MSFVRALKYGAPIIGTAAYSSLQPTIHNETKKRNFYEDEEDVVPIPGTIAAASSSDIEILGPSKLIEGVSVRSPSFLESFFKSARQETISGLKTVEDQINTLSHKYYQTERDVTTTFSDLHERNEDLLPNSIYILIAALSGNILARQRGLVARTAFPLILGVGAFRLFLPQTFTNTKTFVWNLEQKNLPELAKQQEIALTKATEISSSVKETAESSRNMLDKSITTVRKSIADVTGLSLEDDVKRK